MREVRPACLRAATALVDASAVASPDLPPTFEAVVADLHRTLGPWIGADGCTRLLHRAMLLASRAHPSLRAVTVREAAPHLGDLARFAASPRDVGRAAVEAFLGHALQDLGALVGDGIALRIVLPHSPTLWGADEPTDGDDR